MSNSFRDHRGKRSNGTIDDQDLDDSSEVRASRRPRNEHSFTRHLRTLYDREQFRIRTCTVEA